jgi:hypothetical protein
VGPLDVPGHVLGEDLREIFHSLSGGDVLDGFAKRECVRIRSASASREVGFRPKRATKLSSPRWWFAPSRNPRSVV